MKLTALLVMMAGLALAQAPAPTVGRLYEGPFTTLERELVPLVEAMPADKMEFAPTQGEFKGVRTFAQQATHVAAVTYLVAAAMLGEKNPSETGTNENGPATLKTKDDVVKYVKDSFAYAHKALQTLTAENQTEMIASPFGPGKMPRGAAASILTWHGFDHYGQMVVYLRMNGQIPPASRPRQ